MPLKLSLPSVLYYKPYSNTKWGMVDNSHDGNYKIPFLLVKMGCPKEIGR
jgi:hypothetical protein